MSVRDFVDIHFRHFNAGALADCARSLEDFLGSGGRLMVTLAGAMSTAEIGRSLAPAIRSGMVHAITCTGANLEEDLFNLVAHNYYERVDWRNHSVEDDLVLRQRGLNRVTDTCIPEQEAIRKIETHVMDKWQEAIESKETWPASHYLMQVIDEVEHQAERTDSWLAAAVDMGIPVFTPGWADSTLGNVFSARMIQGDVNSDSIIASDLSEMGRLADWYRSVEAPAGLLQIGGGIAGDFPICVVPMLRQDIGEDVPLWAWFAQISESRPSYGGYSGAPPNEKVSWEKLDVDSPKFVIESDATIVVPLLLEYVHR